MTDNEKLAIWQGFADNFYGASLPDYLSDSAACMSLLGTLVEKGYCPNVGMNGTTRLWQCSIYQFFTRMGIELTEPVIDREEGYKTINEAIVAAVLELIAKEDA